MSLNILHGQRADGSGTVDLPLLGRSAAALQPDVLALQEVDVGVPRSGRADQAAAVATATGTAYVFGKAARVGGIGKYGNALLSREPITGVEVVHSGGDQGQLAPMVEQHDQRYQQPPKEMLVDGGFAKKDDIDQVSPPQGGTTVYAPVMKSKDPDRDAHTPRPDDSPAVAEWRQRMATDPAKEIYKERAATAECVNAIARNRGLQRFLVRGLQKVKAVVLWYVLAHNLIRTAALRAAAAPVPG